MLKSCAYCGRIHDSKFNCGKKPEKKFKKKISEKDKFRNTSLWQSKRDKIRERDNNLCQVCIRELYGTVNKFNYEKLSVHHIEKLNEGYDKRLDDNNLITLCSRHHEMADAGLISKNVLFHIVFEQNKIKNS